MLHLNEQNPVSQINSLFPAEETDEQLMQRIQQGEDDALESLHKRHSGLFRSVICRLISNDHDIDELVQECLFEVWKNASNFQSEKGSALGWIVTLVRRRAIDRIRRKASYASAQERFRAEVTEELHLGVDEEVAQSDRAEVVSRLIAKLPLAQQEVVQLAYFKGMTQRQIAAHTQVPLGTIKTRLELALRKLRSTVLAFGELHGEFQGANA